jgi:hypothetical protein
VQESQVCARIIKGKDKERREYHSTTHETTERL